MVEVDQIPHLELHVHLLLLYVPNLELAATHSQVELALLQMGELHRQTLYIRLVQLELIVSEKHLRVYLIIQHNKLDFGNLLFLKI